jgi:hypothetical protein
MTVNPYAAYRLAEEHVREAIHEVQQERLSQVAQGPRKIRGWRLRVASVLGNLLTVFTGRTVNETRQQSPATTSSTG